MKYEISYSQLPERQLKRDKAIQDIIFYCGDKQFNILQTVAMQATNYRGLSIYCSFTGISGYPVVALWDETRQTMKDMTT